MIRRIKDEVHDIGRSNSMANGDIGRSNSADHDTEKRQQACDPAGFFGGIEQQNIRVSVYGGEGKTSVNTSKSR